MGKKTPQYLDRFYHRTVMTNGISFELIIINRQKKKKTPRVNKNKFSRYLNE